MAVSEHSMSSWLGISPKRVSLTALTLQFTAFILLLHYSRVMPTEDGHRYLPSTAIFLVELLKLAISLTVALYQVSLSIPRSMPATSMFGALSHATFAGDSWKMAVPATLYTLANSLQYVGISNLDAATYQVVSQFKIIFTAVFSVVLLRKTLNATQWLSLMLLMIGVAIVSWPDSDGNSFASNHQTRVYVPGSADIKKYLAGLASSAGSLTKRSATYEGIDEDELAMYGMLTDTSVGLAAALCVCLTSGFAGVYFEKVIKEAIKPPSLWVRNVQLALYSLFPAFFIGVLFVDGETVAKNGFFDGYNWVVVLSIVVQAFGGIIVAFCIYYADNISKNFAVSISLVLSSLASMAFLDFSASSNFLVGTIIVLAATYLYGSQDSFRPRAPPPIMRLHSYEKVAINIDEGPSRAEFDNSITLPRTPLKAEEGLSSSRPGSPGRKLRRNESTGYFTKMHD